MGTFRVPDRGSLNASPLGDGWAALASFRPLVVLIDYAGEFVLPPGEGQDEGIEMRRFAIWSPHADPLPVGEEAGSIGRTADQSGF